MRASIVSCVLLLCTGAAQSQTIFFEFADPFGNGTALVGPAQIELDLWLDFPPPGAQNGGAINISYDGGQTSLHHVEPFLPPCPNPGGACFSPGSDDGAGNISQVGIQPPPGAALQGKHLIATFVFNTSNPGPATFVIQEDPAFTFNIPGLGFGNVTVDIIAAQTCISGSLPEGFEVLMGLPANWNNVLVRSPGRDQEGGTGISQWRSSAEPGACDFGMAGTSSDNVTGGDGHAACLQQSPGKGAGSVGQGPALCTTAPLDLGEAVVPVLELNANFQPAGLGGIFKVVGGQEAPNDNTVRFYDVLFQTNQPLGAFASLPGELLVVPLPSVSPYYVCVIVNGDFAYAEVDQCISCALSCGTPPPDTDGDGVGDDVDNCLDVSNTDQRDTDNDGYGNLCDGDFDNNCFVNFVDLSTMKNNFFAPGNLDTDLNGDGNTNFPDLAIMKDLFFLAPGPSGQLTACNGPSRASRAPDCGFE